MKDLCFVTGNQNKFKEVKKLVKTFNLISLNDLNFFDEIQVFKVVKRICEIKIYGFMKLKMIL